MTDSPELLKCPVHLNRGKNPDSVALRDEEVSLTYGDLESRITDCSSRLRSLGIMENDRVGIISSNSIEYATLIYTLYRIGAAAVQINTRQTPGQWRRCLELAGCRLIFVDRERFDAAKGLGYPTHRLDENGWNGTSERGREDFPEEVDRAIRADFESTIIFTSGSTGASRGVVLTFGNHYYSALGSNANVSLEESDCWLAVLPFYHIGGLAILYRSTIAGCSVHILKEFDVSEINRLIDEESISHISLVPTMLDRLIEARGSRLFPGSLKAILLGGAPARERLISRLIDRSTPVLTTYGMTETASQVTTLSPGDPREMLRSAGKPLSYSELRIIDPGGRPVKRNTPGEIAVRGKTVFKGYVGEDTENAFDSGGWFRTGDTGFQDEEGYLFITERKDEMFVSGGENMHPREIENTASRFPGVTESAVVGVPHEKWGHRPGLFVRVAEGSFTGIDDLRAYLERHLPSFMVPEMIVVVDKLPRTTLGKIDKEKLLYDD